MSREEQYAFFSTMAEKAQHFGFKPGFASAKFNEEYGEWPPREWSAELLEIFMYDPQWQAKEEARRIERDHYEAWERDVKPIAEARKAAWFLKHPRPERVGSQEDAPGSLVQCYESEKRGRPLHAFRPGETTALCGKLVSGWLTARKVFTMGTEYGCKKCKKVYAKRNQLNL